MEATNHAAIIGKYVSGNVVVVKTEVRVGSGEKSGPGGSVQWSSGVDRLVVWNLYEARDGKIAFVSLVGEHTDPQTARFIEWLGSFKAK